MYISVAVTANTMSCLYVFVIENFGFRNVPIFVHLYKHPYTLFRRPNLFIKII